MHVPAAAAAAGTGFVGKWLWDYNRENFQNDASQRFGRFMTSRAMLNAQVGQYREDIHGITELTAGKMDTVQGMMTLILCVCAAMSDAGRIGMHGAAPPQWLCGLYSGHIYTSILYCGVALWLAMHGSSRAQCAATSLLTRKVRLPIPSMAQLDSARVFGSSFEQQKLGDIFRVPFMHHPENAPEHPPASSGESEEEEAGDGKAEKGSKKKSKKPKAVAEQDPRTEFTSTARDTVPSWIRDEQVVDKGGGMPGAAVRDDIDPHEAPDHFKMLTEAQKEWWQYDIYARILMLYGVMNFLNAICYYAIGTAICELRGFWISWSIPMTFLAAQVMIMRLDILNSKGNHVLPHVQWFGHMGPYFAVTATTMEFRHVYSQNTVVVTWIFVFLAYFAHLMMNLRFLDLAWPDWNRPNDMPEEPGKAWWPSTWKVPSAFSNALWLLSPPKKLESGQHDLVHEMEGLQQTGGGVACRRRAKGDKKGQKASGKTMQKGEGLIGSDVEGAGSAVPETPASYAGEAEGAYTGKSPFRAFAEARSEDIAWHVTATAILTVAFIWLYLGIALFVEMILGPDTMMKPPGEPPWIRDQKMVPVWKPDAWHMSNMPLPSNYRLESSTLAKYEEDGSVGGFDPRDILAPGAGMSVLGEAGAHGDSHGGGGSHASGAHRRLVGAEGELLRELLKAGENLDWMVHALQGAQAQPAPAPALYDMSPAPAQYSKSPFMAPAAAPNAMQVSWPPLFEPQHLLCRGRSLAAITSRGFGAHVSELSGNAKANAFSLDGLGAIGALAGAAWHEAGLSLVSKAGIMLECPGEGPEQGRWSCAASKAELPLPRDARLAAAAISEPEAVTGHRTAALLFEHLPAMVSLFKEDPGSGTWSAAGEVHLPQEAAGHVGLSFAGQELLALVGKTGAVHRHHVHEGQSHWHVAPPAAGLPREYQSACIPEEKSPLLRLALRPMTAAQEAWLPELTSE
eukprot:TRINITY_DN239_c0_g1_i1.p1 TRINITY_DN239_c0_g1~~TRINITY_DN239_c0_g1_i1.p1  ORF type:complete len:989 (-),score=218.03 TRINITY_DN239_c0_g1_i1:40-2931(-)